MCNPTNEGLIVKYSVFPAISWFRIIDLIVQPQIIFLQRFSNLESALSFKLYTSELYTSEAELRTELLLVLELEKLELELELEQLVVS